MRKLNLVFLAVLMAALLVSSGVVYFVHDFQMKRNSRVLLDQAAAARQADDLSKSAKSLGHYLSLNENDGDAWKRYAEVLDALHDSTFSRRRPAVLHAYQQALRFTPGEATIERRCAEVAMELGSEYLNEAKTHLTNLLDALPADKQGSEKGALMEMLGDCHARESHFEEAAKDFAKAVEADPARISAYAKLARLLRTDLRRNPAEADREIENAVRLNRGSGKAYLCRFKYQREFGDAQTADLQRALELEPNDPEVLLTAALFSQENKQPRKARAHLEKGMSLHPENQEFILALANLELEERNPDRAETLLRAAYERKASPLVAYQLAGLLIQKGKIESEGGAESYLTTLQGNGLLGETLANLLRPRLTMRLERWTEAIGQIESVQATVRSIPSLNARVSADLNMLLAECYRRTNRTEQRIAALQSSVDAAAGAAGPRVLLAQELARSDAPGDSDRALRILRSLTEKRPELEIDIARLMLRRILFQPREKRDWPAFEAQLKKAEEAAARLNDRPELGQDLTLLRVDMLLVRNQAEDARKLLQDARSKNSRNVRYVSALATLAMRQGDKDGEALKILDQAEKELGPSPELRRARLVYWSEKGGPEAKAEVERMAALRERVPAEERPALLDELAQAELRLGQPEKARRFWEELAALQPANLQVLLALADVSLDMGDIEECKKLTERIRDLENPRHARTTAGETAAEETLKGANWRFVKAAYLIRGEASRRPGPGTKGSTPSTSPVDGAALETVRKLAAEIALERPHWWGAPLLQAEIALLNDQEDEAVNGFLRAFELGNTRPSMIQRLVSLLDKKEDYKTIDKVVDRLRDQAVFSPIIKYEEALRAMLKRDFKRGLALAREVFADSPRYGDHLVLGRFYMTAGKADEAGGEFQRAVEIASGVPETWVTYVNYLVRMNKGDEARAAIEAAKKALPPSRAALPVAQCLVLVGEVAQAGRLMEQAVGEHPNDPTTLRVAAGFFLGRGQTDKAIRYLETLRAPAPGATAEDLAWATRAQAIALMRTGRPADRAAAEQLIGANPSTAADRLLKATVLSADSRPKSRREAINILEALDREDKLGVNDQVRLARLYLSEERDAKKFQDAMLKVLSAGGARNPRHLALYVGHLIDQNDLDEASHWLDELKRVEPTGLAALEMEALLLTARKKREREDSEPPGATGRPAPPEVRDLLVAGSRRSPELIGPVALLLSRFGYPAEAEAAYREFIARDPKRPERVLTLATFLAGQKGRAEEALKILAGAWETCPHEQVAASALALYDAPSVTEDQRKQIEAWLTEASRSLPDMVALSTRLGAIWIRQGKFDQAESKYRQILNSHPDNVEARNNLAWLLALRDTSKIEEAEQLIEGAIAQVGPSASLLDTKAVVLIRAGRIPEALEALSTAAAIDPRNASVPLHAAWARHAEGNQDEARKAFQKAVQLGWTVDRSDPLERAYVEKLRSDLRL